MGVFFIFLAFLGSPAFSGDLSWSLSRLHGMVDRFSPDGTLETFLEKNIVPEDFNLVFVHDSHSLQYGDDATPRLFLVSPDKKLTLTIVGYPYGVGWEAIEIMEDDKSKGLSSSSGRFTFAEIVFPRNSLSFEHGSVKNVSWNGYRPPEQRCIGCHRAHDGSHFMPVRPQMISSKGDRGFWGLQWSDETLRSWKAFQTGFLPNSRYNLFADKIRSQTPDSLAKGARDYFESISEPQH